MGMGIAGRFFQGVRNAVNTVSVAEAHMAQTKKVEAPKTYPELGVLQFGSRFQSMEGTLNPFNSGVRPATGPTVARPGMEQFKGTGGAFAGEQTLQMTSGLRGLDAPVGQFQQLSDVAGRNPQIQAMQSQVASLPPGTDPMAAIAMESARAFQTQQAMENMDRMFKTISQILASGHEIAMNAIRNMKG
jgi:hypothetical protein